MDIRTHWRQNFDDEQDLRSVMSVTACKTAQLYIQTNGQRCVMNHLFVLIHLWIRSVSVTLGNDLSQLQLETNADSSGNCSTQEISEPPTAPCMQLLQISMQTQYKKRTYPRAQSQKRGYTQNNTKKASHPTFQW